MFRLNLKNGVKANVWIDEEPIIDKCECNKLLVEDSAELIAISRKLIVELFIPRAHSNYALLGVDFSASENGKVIVELGINNKNQGRHNSSIALPFDTVILGIIEEFEEGITLSVGEHLKTRSLPSGIINYNISAYGEMGSSTDMFKKVSDILLSLLLCDDLNEFAISKIIEEKIYYNRAI